MSESEAGKRIAAARACRATELDLSRLGLTRVPSEVTRLRKLEVLSLRGNELRSVPPKVASLPRLRRLDLRGNPLEEIPDQPGLVLDWATWTEHRRDIVSGRVLGIHVVEPLDEVAVGLCRLPALRLLHLGVADDTPPVREEAALDGLLRALPSLEELIIVHRQLTSFPPAVLGLDHLRLLSLGSDPVGPLPHGIARLTHLRHLAITDAGLTELPDGLFDLADLESLWLSFNSLRVLPERVRRLTNLQSLGLTGNDLSRLPNLTDLQRLRRLSIGGNVFDEIPSTVFDVPLLEELSLWAPSEGVHWLDGPKVSGVKPDRGRIRHIPPDILRLGRLRVLNTAGQPIETPPPEVVDKGVVAIQDYWRQRSQVGTDYLCEAKLIIVGEAGAGKTSLSRKIQDAGYALDAAEPSTEGIRVVRWGFPCLLHPKGRDDEACETRDFKVNIWDFGGQEIYHATHQFFLTRRSVYALVADDRKEDTDFQYWLSIVELLSDGSPLVIVENEKQDRRRDIDEERLRRRFPNLREVLATNLATNRGLDDVVRCLRRHLEGLPHIGDPLPATWKRVRDALEEEPRDHIPLDEYLRICETHGFQRLDDKLQLSGYLHDLGICLHFQDDPLLRKTVILNPRWATDAVYRVLDADVVAERHGRFAQRDLAAIWADDQHAPMRDELLQLMTRFQLCYRLDGEDAYIAPQHLSVRKPRYPWDERDNLALRYRYEFMPKGILTRFIVAVHPLIESQDHVWKNGVVLERDGTRCEVVEDYHGREIRVRAVGPYPRDLLTIVDHEIGRIHRTFPKLRYDVLVPCRCGLCKARQEPHFHPLEALRRFARDGRAIQCHASYEMVDAAPLIDTVLGPARRASRSFDGPAETARDEPGRDTSPDAVRREVFVSYAWAGASEAIVDQLAEAFDRRGVALVRDRNEMTYRDSIRDFMRRLGRGKCVVVVLSEKYLRSPNCLFELTEIAAQEDFRDRIFPVVLPDAGIFRPLGLLAHVTHWEREIATLDAAMKQVEQTNLEPIQAEINRYRGYRATIAGLTDLIADMNSFDVATHVDSAFDALLTAIEARLGE